MLLTLVWVLLSFITRDDDKSFRSHVSDYARDSGWVNTRTGGYNPNGNSIVERRIGMLNQSVRTMLLCATGGLSTMISCGVEHLFTLVMS